MPTLNLTSQERSALRAAAHSLRPSVIIGDKGLSDAVLKEITIHLQAHQLIKIRVAGDDRELRIQILTQICEALDAAPIHHLGKILTIYKPNPDRPDVLAPETIAPTRAVRKASEPYTPKKLAATGQQRTRQSERTRRESFKAEKKLDEEQRAIPKAQKKFATPVKPASPRSASRTGETRRTGSALSLKAGARRRSGSSNY